MTISAISYKKCRLRLIVPSEAIAKRIAVLEMLADQSDRPAESEKVRSLNK